MKKRMGESGNIFFTLFGAVALVGVVGAATSTLMRGPVGTVVALNQRAKADSQMQIAMKLAMLEAQNNSNDCDGDTFIEPVGAGVAIAGLTGGGRLPQVGSTTNDPWGSPYGYCGWNHGTDVTSTCSGGTTPLLRGHAAGQGTVIAVLSAGPDRTFGTTCVDNPAASAPYITRTALPGNPGNDDLIVSMTYSEANEASGGLWSISSTNPDAITTNRSLDVSTGAQFSSGEVSFQGSRITGSSVYDPGSSIDLRAGGLFMLPTELQMTSCSGALDKGLLRRFTDAAGAGNLEVLQICDGTGWLDIGGAGAIVAAAGNPGEIQYNAAGLMGASSALVFNSNNGLTVGGDSIFSSDLRVNQSLLVNNALSVTGNSTLTGTLDVDGAADFDSTIDVALGATFGSWLRGSDGTAGAPTYSFTSDNDSGMFFSSSALRFSVDGSERMAVSAGGVTMTAGQALGNFTVNGTLTTNDLSVTNNITANRFISRMASTSAANPGFETEPGTGMYSAVDNTLSLVAGGTPRIVIDGTGDVGIGVLSPDAKLDVGGEIKVGTSNLGCGPTLHGAIRYVSGDLLQVCSSVTGSWEDIGTSGGGGGGAASYWTRISAVDTRLYYDDAFVGVGTNNPLDDFHVAGDLLVTGGYTGTASVGVSGAGSRMFFDPESGAFRAGSVSGGQWDSGLIGNYSYAFGYDAQANGLGARALGSNVTASGTGSLVIGENAQATNLGSAALGLDVVSSGTRSTIWGLGDATGASPIVSGTESFVTVMGDRSGVNVTANNTWALLGGRMLIDQNPPVNPATSGTLSLDVEGGVGAMQYCDENGVNCFTAASVATGGVAAPGNNRELIYNSGGVLGANPNMTFSSAGNLTLGGTGAIGLPSGDGTNRPAASADGMLRYNTALGRFEGYQGGAWRDLITGAALAAGANTQIQFNSNGSFGAVPAFTFAQGELRVDGSDYNRGGVMRIRGAETPAANYLDATMILESTASGRIWSQTLVSNIPARNGDLVFAHYNGSTWAEPLILATNGRIGIFSTTPRASLDINTTDAIVLPVGSVGNRPASPVDGMLRYNSQSGKFEGYQGGAWQDILTSAVTGGAASPNRGIQFNSNGSFAAVSQLQFTSGGSLLTTGTYSGVGDTSLPTGVGTRFFFDPTKAAFRAGFVDGAEWDNASVGTYSTALGYKTTASGQYSTALGSGTTASQMGSVALGISTTASAGSSTAMGLLSEASGAVSLATGLNTTASGYVSTAMGEATTASGQNATAMGIFTTASGIGATAMGWGATASGTQSTAMGIFTTASGSSSMALGQGAAATATNSGAIGFGSATGLMPSVNAQRAFGLFFGDQSGVTMADPVARDTMGIFGGKLVFDPRVPALQTSARAHVDFGASTDAVLLPIGDGTNRPATPVNGMIRYNNNSNKFEGYQNGAWQDILTSAVAGGAAAPNRGIQFNSNGSFAATTSFQYTSGGSLLMLGNHTGSNDTSLPTGAGSRMFFDAGTSAFRAGRAFGAEWDFTSVGEYSAGFGVATTASNFAATALGGYTTASGDYALAAGDSSVASGEGSVAFGVSSVASGQYSIAMGDASNAQGRASFAVGSNAQASANYTIALGLNSAATAANATAMGYNTVASGTVSTAMGGTTTASGQFSTAMGNRTTASGNYSMATGVNTTASGAYSFAMGRGVAATQTSTGAIAFGSATGLVPSVNAQNAFGLFFGDQSGVTMADPAARDTMGIFGGKLVFDPRVPALQTSARAHVDFGASTDAVLLPTGDGTNRPAAPVNGMIRYNNNSNKFEGYQNGAWQDILTSAVAGGAASPNRGVQFNSGGSFGAASDFVYSSGGFLGLGVSNPQQKLDIAGNIGLTSSGMLYSAGKPFLSTNQVLGNLMLTVDNYGANPHDATGAGNTVVGNGAAEQLTSGGGNTIVGATAGYDLTTQVSNVLIGSGTGVYLDGDYNTALGTVALQYANPGVGDSVYVGFAAGGGNSGDYGGGARSTIIGSYAGQFADGADNIFMGYYTGNSASTGARNIMIGHNLQLPTAATSDYLNIGNLLMGVTNAGILAVNGTGALVVPVGTTAQQPAGVNGMLRYNSQTGKFEGFQAGSWQDIVTGAVTSNFLSLTDTPSSYVGEERKFVRVNAGSTALEFTDEIVPSVSGEPAPAAAILDDLGDVAITTPTAGQILTYSSGQWVNAAAGGVALAIDDLTDAQTVYSSASMFLGQGAGANVGPNTDSNTALGMNALNQHVEGNWNTAVGASALRTLGGAGLRYSNTALGAGAGEYMSVGSDNIMLGAYAMSQMSNATGNVAIGTSALNRAGGGTGDYNVAIGYEAANNLSAGSNNITIGSHIDVANPTGDYQLNIGNLITGTLNAGLMQINGTGALTLPVGTTAQQPAGVNGMLRYNSQTGKFEGFQAGSWQDIVTGAAGGSAANPDRGIQFNSGGSFAASANLVYTSAGMIGSGTANPLYNLHLQAMPTTNGAAYIGLSHDMTGNRTVGIDFFTNHANPAGNIDDGDNRGWSFVAYGDDPYHGGNARKFGLKAHQAWAAGDRNYLALFDGDTNRIALGAGGQYGSLPRATLDILGTDAIILPSGTTAQQPAGVNGMLRYNSQTGKFEGFQSGSWQDIVTGAATSSFLSLTDTPASYAGEENKYVRVNAGSTALEFTDQIVPSVSGQPTPLGTVLDDLADVVIATPTAGQILTYSSGQWVNAAAGAGTVAIDDLTDAIANYTSHNIYLGQGVGSATTTGTYNTALGSGAAQSLTTGSGNVAIGASALASTIAGGGNIAIGNSALQWGNVANQIAIGYSALAGANGGQGNIALGNQAGSTITDGEFNIMIGDAVNVADASGDYQLNIGNLITGTLNAGLMQINGTGALTLPIGTTAQQPTGVNGMLRYNSETNKFEGYQAGSWNDIVTGAATGGAASPSGAVQFNSGGSFGGSANFTWNTGTSVLGVTGSVNVSNRINIAGQSGSAPIGTSLSGLSDVALATPTAGQVLTYSGGQWINATASGGSASAAGATTNIQFNSGGSMGAAATFVYTSTGNMGVGTSSPAAKVHAYSAATGNTVLEGLRLTRENTSANGGNGIGNSIGFQAETSSGVIVETARIESVLYDAANNSKDADLRFYTLGRNASSGTTTATESMRIDSNGTMFAGRMGSSLISSLQGGWTSLGFAMWGRDMSLMGEGGNYSDLYLSYYGDDAAGSSEIIFYRNRNTIATPYWPNGGDSIGRLTFTTNGVSNGAAARIQISASQTHNTGTTPAIMDFLTTPNGSSTPLERMSIKETGRIQIGTGTPRARLDVNGAIQIGNDGETCSSAADRGSIRFNGTEFEVCRDHTQGWGPMNNAPIDAVCDDSYTFSSPGTFGYRVPANFGTLTIRMWGGGGGGGGANNVFMSPANGASGTSSTIISRGLSAGGGAGGLLSTGTPGNGSAGGTAAGGDVNTNGNAGGNAVNSTSSGAGGNAPGTGGGSGGAAAAYGMFINGNAGNAPGGGGSGGTDSINGAAEAGGGGSGAYVEKILTTADIAPGTIISDIVVGSGGGGGSGGGSGGSGGNGRIVFDCVSGPPDVALNDLNDVTITAPANGQTLFYSGGQWVNGSGGGGGGAINDLSDAATNYTSANLFMGRRGGEDITTGAGNTSVGTDALADVTGGDGNTAMGANAMTRINTGYANTAVGSEAMAYHTGSWENTAVGGNAMAGGTGSSANTAIGALALADSGGGANTAIGARAGMALQTGMHNTFLGQRAGDNLTDGSYNIIIGSDVDASSATVSNELNIGNTIYGDLSSDRIGIGKAPDAGVELDVLGDVQYTGTLTDVSDMRLKDNILPLNDRGSMLGKLDQIGTYSFTMKDDKNGQVEFGVMAQEINKVFPELVKIDEASAEKYMSVNYVGLIAPLIEASKELKSENESLKAQISAIEERMASVEGDMNGMKAHTGYGISKAQMGLGMMLGMMLMGGMAGIAMIVVNRRRRQP